MAWDRAARAYDWQLLLERAALRAIVAMLEPRPSDRLLDVGTGTGAVLRELARHAGAPREAVGLDTSAAMLARVPELPAGWSVHLGDATRLPFADASFDLAAAAYLLHLLESPQRAEVLAEMRRVLRPGGRLGVVTVAPPSSPLAATLAAPLLGAARRSRGVLAGLRPLDPAPELERAGFEVRPPKRVSGGYPSLCVLACS